MVKIVITILVLAFLYYLAQRTRIRFVASSGDDGNKL